MKEGKDRERFWAVSEAERRKGLIEASGVKGFKQVEGVKEMGKSKKSCGRCKIARDKQSTHAHREIKIQAEDRDDRLNRLMQIEEDLKRGE